MKDDEKDFKIVMIESIRSEKALLQNDVTKNVRTLLIFFSITALVIMTIELSSISFSQKNYIGYFIIILATFIGVIGIYISKVNTISVENFKEMNKINELLDAEKETYITNEKNRNLVRKITFNYMLLFSIGILIVIASSTETPDFAKLVYYIWVVILGSISFYKGILNLLKEIIKTILDKPV
ncbi:MAG: hypothetical protein FWD92_01235 [Methanomassiliicoccaceae archaeon]|nr:hypothetical protein [Methanomassiliicoccaceae archaeon]